MLSPLDLVKEISKLLESENICYVHRESREIFTFEIAASESNETAIIEIEDKISKYIKLVPMPAQKLKWLMESFLLEMTDDELRKELSAALKRKKPIRNFMNIIETRFDIKQHWKLFKEEQYEEYVSELFIKDYNY